MSQQTGNQLYAELDGQITHDRESNAPIGKGLRAGPASHGLGDAARVIPPGQCEPAESETLLDQASVDLTLVHGLALPHRVICTHLATSSALIWKCQHTTTYKRKLPKGSVTRCSPCGFPSRMLPRCAEFLTDPFRTTRLVYANPMLKR